jgi:type II secretory pathway component PulF
MRPAATSVERGEDLAEALGETGALPKFAVHLLHTGARTGTLEESLDTIAGIEETEVQASASALLAVLEPVLMVVMGLVIGAVLIAMYLPIFELSARAG